MKKKIIIANWKANPITPKEAVLLAQRVERGVRSVRSGEVVIAPPFHFLASVGKIFKKTALGAQDAFWGEGPYTGEVSARQLKALGVKYVILGHSERRMYLGETDEMVNRKVKAVLAHGLGVILCIGERERAGNDIPADTGRELVSSLHGVPKRFAAKLAVAYEPVWAISTQPGSRPDTPDNAFRAMIYIRKILSGLYGRSTAEKIRILYGGSVNERNAASFICEGKMEGLLVGGTSLRPDEFIRIVKSV